MKRVDYLVHAIRILILLQLLPHFAVIPELVQHGEVREIVLVYLVHVAIFQEEDVSVELHDGLLRYGVTGEPDLNAAAGNRLELILHDEVESLLYLVGGFIAFLEGALVAAGFLFDILHNLW